MAKTSNPRWIDCEPAWDIHFKNGDIHHGVTESKIAQAVNEMRRAGKCWEGEYVDTVRQKHIDLYEQRHTEGL